MIRYNNSVKVKASNKTINKSAITFLLATISLLLYCQSNVTAFAKDKKQDNYSLSEEPVQKNTSTSIQKHDRLKYIDAQKDYKSIEMKILNHNATVQQAIPAIDRLLYVGLYDCNDINTLQSLNNLIEFARSDSSVSDTDKMLLGLILIKYQRACTRTNDLNSIADIFLSIENSRRKKIMKEDPSIYYSVMVFHNILRSQKLYEKADRLITVDDYHFHQ